MKTRITFIYDEDRVVNEQDFSLLMKTNDLSEAIGLTILFKEKYGFVPYGFSLMTYEKEKDNISIVDIKTYFLNGQVINIDNIAWLNINQEIKENITSFIYFNDNFCIPMDKNTFALNINI